MVFNFSIVDIIGKIVASFIVITYTSINPNQIVRKYYKSRLKHLMHRSSMYVGTSYILSSYASGTSTGTVLDASGGVRYTVPVYEGLYLRSVSQLQNTKQNRNLHLDIVFDCFYF